MKIYRLLLVLAVFASVVSFSVRAQTLYNGVGHIPAVYQERWNKAGLLRDMSSVEPKKVITVLAMPGAAHSDKVDAAIDTAKNHVSTTQGLSIIYFPTGTYYLSRTIALAPNDSNIVFQGAGSDRTILEFQNLKDSHCFSFYGATPLFSSQSDLDQNFNKGDSIIHAANGYGLSSINSGDWIHFIKHKFDYIPGPGEPGEAEIVGQITRLEDKGTDGNGDWGEIKDVANMNYIDSQDTEYSLKVRKVTPVQNIGIENLKILRSPNEQATVDVSNIWIENAVNCWVKGVESYKASRNHLNIYRSAHIEVSGCYFHEAMHFGDGGWGYGAALSICRIFR